MLPLPPLHAAYVCGASLGARVTLTARYRSTQVATPGTVEKPPPVVGLDLDKAMPHAGGQVYSIMNGKMRLDLKCIVVLSLDYSAVDRVTNDCTSQRHSLAMGAASDHLK